MAIYPDVEFSGVASRVFCTEFASVGRSRRARDVFSDIPTFQTFELPANDLR